MRVPEAEERRNPSPDGLQKAEWAPTNAARMQSEIPLMKPRTTRFLPALLLAALPLAPLLAERGPHGRPFGGDGPPMDGERMERLAEHQAERLTRALALTPEQQVTLGRLQDQLEAAVRPLGETMRTAHRQLRTLLDAETPDPAAVGTQAIAIDRARDAMRAAWDRFEADLQGSLTESQRAAYRVLQESRPGRGFGGHRGRGPGGPLGADEDDSEG